MGDKKTILITGANGLVGYRACEFFRARTPWTIIGTSRKNGLLVDIPLDLTNPSAAEQLKTAIQPDVVIHTAALSRTDVCEGKKELCHAINVDVTNNLCQVFPDVKFIYFSTYAVYDTPHGGCDERCKTRASNYYIQTKLEAECCVRELKDHIILRPSVIFGYMKHLQESKNYFMQLLDNIRDRRVMRSPLDQYFNPVFVDVVVEILTRIIEDDLCGIYNIGSNESISKYEFNHAVMDRFGFNLNNLEGIDSALLSVKRPAMGTISSEAIQERLKYRIPPLDQMMDTLYITSAKYVEKYLADAS